MMVLYLASAKNDCSWGYRFDKEDNHFNIVYPDKNAVYFGFILPKKTENFTIASHKATFISSHPVASYFSIQIYNSIDLASPMYHWIDTDIMGSTDQVMDLNAPFQKTMILDPINNYFAVFRIYNSFYTHILDLCALKTPTFGGGLSDSIRFEKCKDFNSIERYKDTLYYWAGFPPSSYINGIDFPLCNIDYREKDNIYSNLSNTINSHTGTVCSVNEQFTFMIMPEGSLANSDANYLIACIQPNTKYNIRVKMPQIMCSVGYTDEEPRPWINETYDLRYASMNIESTMAPRPTVESYVIPCDEDDYQTEIWVDDEVPYPALLYRQILPSPDFKYSIAYAKEKCYPYANNKYDVQCIQKYMGDYYPFVIVV